MWKPIPRTKGQYEASDTGEIRNARTGKVLKQTVTKQGYAVICLNGFATGVYTVAQLVGETFLEGEGDIHHINGNKLDNRVENLTHGKKK